MAVRQNKNKIHNMQEATRTVLYHFSESSSKESWHLYCSKESDNL